MATNTQIQSFIDNMSSFATQAGNALGVDPNTILAQWALESNYGTSNLAVNDNNYGGLGGSTNPLSFSSPSAFEQAYVNTIQNTYPNAVGAGNNSLAFVSGLYGAPQGSSVQQDISALSGTQGYSTSQTGASYGQALTGALNVISQFVNPSTASSNSGANNNANIAGLINSLSNGSLNTNPQTLQQSPGVASSVGSGILTSFENWLASSSANIILVIIGIIFVIGIFITLLMNNKTIQTAAKAAFV